MKETSLKHMHYDLVLDSIPSGGSLLTGEETEKY